MFPFMWAINNQGIEKTKQNKTEAGGIGYAGIK